MLFLTHNFHSTSASGLLAIAEQLSYLSRPMTPLDPPVTEIIPEHLLPFIAQQDPGLYTPMDHASWRYILRVSQKFFKTHAHRKYLDGLEATGISIERIPLIHEMDACLRNFGWRAVAVCGFVPPAVFLEFQSLGILVIACDMRVLQHLAYTPAPDIVHEAAGHAPILADPEYRAYLRSYGEVARHAIFSKQDIDLYDAIRDLSDIKENPTSTKKEIAEAQKRFEDASHALDHVSEAAQLSRMAWWTLEYGLVGDIAQPKIYGAGLLSSVGESYNCIKPEVKKLPLTYRCVEQSYDITRPQPQLFVTPDFATLNQVLEDFANTMAFRQGGLQALNKGLQAKHTTTTVLDSGIQISSILERVDYNSRNEPVFLKFKGPTQLAFKDQEIPDQGPKTHPDGFSAPIGKILLNGKLKSPADLTERELLQLGFEKDKQGKLTFESGVTLQGVLVAKVPLGSRNIILTFDKCAIHNGNQTLYQPEWGRFDLACGISVVSVFGGAADRAKYVKATGGYRQRPSQQKSNLTPENRQLNEIYAKVRALRETKDVHSKDIEIIYHSLQLDYPGEWLLRLELLELAGDKSSPWIQSLKSDLQELAKASPSQNDLIKRGLELLQ